MRGNGRDPSDAELPQVELENLENDERHGIARMLVYGVAEHDEESVEKHWRLPLRSGAAGAASPSSARSVQELPGKGPACSSLLPTNSECCPLVNYTTAHTEGQDLLNREGRRGV